MFMIVHWERAVSAINSKKAPEFPLVTFMNTFLFMLWQMCTLKKKKDAVFLGTNEKKNESYQWAEGVIAYVLFE